MSAVVADTHAIIWYLINPDKLSTEALIALDGAINNGYPIYISAISIVEIVYLTEKNKIPEAALEQLLQTLNDSNPSLVVASLDQSVAQSLAKIPRLTVPEMGDRIIAATALHLSLPLVTKDYKIRALSLIQTIW
ncbi:MAG: type II toxin-antitoxin system VapC family toxin [Sphaerospermopsis sp. SIO1G1]|nr:type II toxin-antitoxin system VapC family toxin [Sphaerospermopsis sp. SIO1G1]